MAPLTPHWTQPSHPDIQEVILPKNPSDFTTKSISRIPLAPYGLFAKFSFPPCTKAEKPTYATVQVGEKEHISLNSDLVYINHSCEPSVIFDTSSLSIIAGPKGLKIGDELTFFYPSTEWHMDQPFDCFCGHSTCKGHISGAGTMHPHQLVGMWLNVHIRKLLERQHAAGVKMINALLGGSGYDHLECKEELQDVGRGLEWHQGQFINNSNKTREQVTNGKVLAQNGTSADTTKPVVDDKEPSQTPAPTLAANVKIGRVFEDKGVEQSEEKKLALYTREEMAVAYKKNKAAMSKVLTEEKEKGTPETSKKIIELKARLTSLETSFKFVKDNPEQSLFLVESPKKTSFSNKETDDAEAKLKAFVTLSKLLPKKNPTGEALKKAPVSNEGETSTNEDTTNKVILTEEDPTEDALKFSLEQAHKTLDAAQKALNTYKSIHGCSSEDLNGSNGTKRQHGIGSREMSGEMGGDTRRGVTSREMSGEMGGDTRKE